MWTRDGCVTSAAERGYGDYVNDTFINCTCDHLSSFAVILNDAEAEVKISMFFFSYLSVVVFLDMLFMVVFLFFGKYNIFMTVGYLTLGDQKHSTFKSHVQITIFIEVNTPNSNFSR